MDIVAVVFKYGVRAQGVAQHPRILFNDAGVGSRQNDSVQMMPPGVLQGESQRGKRFAAAGGHREGECAGRQRGGIQTMLKDLFSGRYNGAVARRREQKALGGQKIMQPLA